MRYTRASKARCAVLRARMAVNDASSPEELEEAEAALAKAEEQCAEAEAAVAKAEAEAARARVLSHGTGLAAALPVELAKVLHQSALALVQRIL